MLTQPKSNQLIEDGGIKIGYSEEKIRKLIATSRGQELYVIGLNNHINSGVTLDLAIMQKYDESAERDIQVVSINALWCNEKVVLK